MAKLKGQAFLGILKKIDEERNAVHTGNMVNQALLDFVSGEVAKGTPLPEIRSMLAQKGWQTVDIDSAFNQFGYGQPPQASTSQALPQGQTPQKNSSKKTCLIVGIVGCVGCLGLIAVIGIFSSALILAINPAAMVKKAKMVSQRNTMSSTRNALLRYYVEKTSYPSSLDRLVPDFMAEIPRDEFTQEPLLYSLATGKSDFSLCGYFADGKKDQVCIDSKTEEIAPQLFPSSSGSSESPPAE